MLRHFTLSHGFLAHYANLMCRTVIPFQESVLRDEVPGVAPSHAIQNFANAAYLRKNGHKSPENGDFYGMVFQDSDVAKWLEAAAYSLVLRPDSELEERIERICDLIAAAQEEDGYLNTHFTLVRPHQKFTNLLEGHELYCAGHMMEAAVALYEATGNKKLLSIMAKNADLLYRHFITEGAEGYPGHPEVELALIRLWKATGVDRYRELAEHFVNIRGVDPDFYIKERELRDWQIWGNDPRNREYQQSHLPVREQKDAVGHAVRAVYLYSAMADLAAVTHEDALTEACFHLFDSITKRRMYITGGIGSTAAGEAFSTDYDLPNDSVYAETCASIGLIFFAHRLLKLKRDGRIADVMERALYNTVPAGIELDGTKFFYANPLEVIPGSAGCVHPYGHVRPQRPGWFGCACCPPNAARLLTSISKYVWDCVDGILYADLFAAGELELPEIHIRVETAYPFGDTVKYTVLSGESPLAIRIPAFSRENYAVSSAGEYRDGYYYTTARAGDVITVKLDMTPKLNRADPRVARNSGMGAVTVGPLVFCAEGVDNNGDVLNFSLDSTRLTLNTEALSKIGGFPASDEDLDEIYTVTAEGAALISEDPDELYFSDHYRTVPRTLKLIPYFLWGNRGLNQMRVWMPIQ